MYRLIFQDAMFRPGVLAPNHKPPEAAEHHLLEGVWNTAIEMCPGLLDETVGVLNTSVDSATSLQLLDDLGNY